MRTWVTKTDVTQYLRCPYRVYLSHKDGMPYDDFIPPFVREMLFNPGVAFEQETVTPIEESTPEAASTRSILFRFPEVIRNHDLGIMGVPDVIASEKGKFIPIEVKFHKSVTDTDRLELAFYWRLLEPIRKSKVKPRGCVFVKTGDIVEVDLEEGDFAKLESVIDLVRRTKTNGCEPSIVEECSICRLKDEHTKIVVSRQGLSLLHGVAAARERELKIVGIRNFSDLVEADAHKLDQRWKAVIGHTPGANQIAKMQEHALAWLDAAPRLISSSNKLLSQTRALLLDLEYDQNRVIFLVGLLIIERGECAKVYQGFAHTAKEEGKILDEFCCIASRHSTYPIVTWNGKAADFPQLKNAWSRCELSSKVLDNLVKRHVDLLPLALESCRLPLKSFALGDLAAYFGFIRRDPNIQGIMMPMIYADYIRASDKRKKESLKSQMLSHNRDDLDACLLVWREFLRICKADSLSA